MWCRHASFSDVVHRCRTMPIAEQGMLKLKIKLSRLKQHLRHWNKEVFGNLFHNISQAEIAVQQAEKTYDSNPSDVNLLEMNHKTATYQNILAAEEDYWKQKASCKWMAEGERNTKYFHSLVKKKRARAGINLINQDEVALTIEPKIKDSGVHFFIDLLKTEGPLNGLDWIAEIIPCIVTEEMGVALCRPVTSEEVKGVVFDMDANSTAGLDEFNVLFYQQCWNVIHHDVVDAVEDFMSGMSMPKSFTATSIVLIPKMKNPDRWGNFRPISLCNTTNKIISKLLIEQLKPRLPKLISPNQSGYIATRQIGDNILLAQEIIHSISSHKSD
ncbi:UNVERIFIED_CONTAM: hypothetical protein Slati_2748500 [Sesamum latifolium]|uniref:Reverse transcriptase domain-containing protein n=1 Tax=Sesamum latifolium TaxID=2727402 RepID=A0AAW2VX49_9LAMI